MIEASVTGVRMQLTAAAYNVVVTGDLPIGDSTETITHFIIDTTSNSVVGQVALPNAVAKKTAVSLIVKVPNASGTYEIGTFGNDGGFRASSFLSVRNPTDDQRPSGALGRTG